MARLPIPGGDDGAWGSILNDFLGQTHAADGTLKTSAVGAAALAAGAVTAAKIATTNAPTAGRLLLYDGADLVWTAPSSIAQDHGDLMGLGDDDHPQYHTDARGDVRYYTKAQVDSSLADKVELTDSRLTDTRTPTDGTVSTAKVQDDAITEPKLAISNTPTSGYVLSWNGSALAWITQAGGGDPSLGGDLTGTASAAQIAAGAIVDADVNAGAAIAQSKIANLTTDLAGKQPLDSDLTTIAGLTPTNDDIIQRKAGAWTNRTPAQLKTDLVLTKSDVGLPNVDNTSDVNKPISTATQTALDGKAATTHTHAIADVTNLQTTLDTKPTISSGAGVPASTPTKVGDIYIDTTGDDAYIAVGTASSADWEKSNDGAGGGIADGDKGDITVSGSGATWTIDAGAVTYAKLQDVSTNNRLLGRITAGAGDAEELTAANVRTIINVADGATANSSDATLLDRANHTGTQAISTVTSLQTTLDGKAATSHTHAATEISDSTATGRSVLTAADAAAARTAIGAGTSSFDGQYSSLTGQPTLGGAAALNVGTGAGTVAAGNDARFTDARTPLTHATSHAAAGSDPIAPVDILAVPAYHDFTAGESNYYDGLVHSNGVATSGGTLRFVYFVAQRTETINNLTVYSGSTAAGATPTLVRYGVYTVDGSGNLTLAHSIANDTAIFASTNTGYTRALTSSWSKVKGTRYAIGVLVVTAAAAPTLTGQSVAALANIMGGSANKLRRTSALTSQTDLPASATSGSLTGSSAHYYVEMT